jgi:filamentous hemagglutinin family protein
MLGGVLGMVALFAPPSQAQIVPDATLPQGSIVLDRDTGVEIVGGTIAGANLFHSFEQFGLRDGDRATFVTPSGIDRILARVTGSAIAEIDGILSANTDLIFLAPNGIHFGDRASLDLSGSFLATTASAIDFSDGVIWPSIATESSPLLSVNVPIGLQFDAAIEPGTISAIGGEQVTTILSMSETLANVMSLSEDALIATINSGRAESVLAMAPGQTLGFIGGNIDLQRTQIDTFGGAIVLGSVRSGRVALTDPPASAGFNLDFDRAELGGSIQLRDRAALTSNGFPNGSITLAADSIAINNGASVQLQNLGSQPGGNLSFIATGTVSLDGSLNNDQGSFVNAITLGPGSSSNIEILADRLDLTQGGNISTLSFSSGMSGNLNINVGDQFSLLGFQPGRSGSVSNISSSTLVSGTGGHVNVQGPHLVLDDGGAIFTLTTGSGRSGDLQIKASNSIRLQGVEPGNQGSSLGTATLGAGTAGNVEVETPQLSLLNGARVGSLSVAAGHAGDVTLNSAESIVLRGQDPSLGGSSIFSSAELFTTSTLLPQSLFSLVPNIDAIVPTGDAGNLIITTPLLQVEDAGQIQIANRGFGNPGRLTFLGETLRLTSGGTIAAQTVLGSGGVIDLDLRLLELSNGSISTATVDSGRGSDIRIRASDRIVVSANSLEETQTQAFGVFFSNNAIPSFNIGIISGSLGEGTAGNIEIETGELILRNGGLITPAALRSGDAGSLTIRVAGDIMLDGGTLSTATISQASDAGRGGDIVIEAENLSILNGSSITTTTLGRNDAGRLQVNIRDQLLLGGGEDSSLFITSGLSSGALNLGLGSVGNGGDMSITAHSLILSDRAGISSSSDGRGNAGSIDLRVDQLVLDGGAFIAASSNSGKGGNLSIQASSSTIVRNLSRLSTQAGSAVTGGGDGGNLLLETGVFAAIEASQISANAFSGSGGQITIEARGFFLGDRSTIDASSELGIDGVIDIENDTIVSDPSIVSLSSELLTHNLLEQDCSASNRDRFSVVNNGRALEQFNRTLETTASWHDDRDWRDLTPSNTLDRAAVFQAPDAEPTFIEANRWHDETSNHPQLIGDPALSQEDRPASSCPQYSPMSPAIPSNSL